MEFDSLRESHIDGIAEILMQNYAAAAAALPLMPPGFESAEQIAARMKKHAGDEGFVVALDGGRVAGFIGAYHIPGYKGTAQGALCLANMHGVAPGYDKCYVYDELYRRASGLWAGSGSYTHAIRIYSHDAEIVNTWAMNGFGIFVMDAVRAPEQIPVIRDGGMEIIRAREWDIPDMLGLLEGIDKHLASPPVFLYGHRNQDYLKDYTSWIGEREGNHLWAAKLDGVMAGYLMTGLANVNMPELDDGRTMAITGAYTLPGYRGRHIMATLLDEALGWARERGLARCSVDFETANIDGRRFWLKYFTPVSCAMIRRIDERACTRP